MFLDKVRIFIKAGNGGDGSVSFHREKYVVNGGPNGGDGGNGGNVVFVADAGINTLINFKFMKHFRAIDGGNGAINMSRGKNGSDSIVKVPLGTVIKDFETGGIISDMFYEGETCVVASGGRGGKGNMHFATSTRQAPRFAQKGVKTDEYSLILELKTIADVGLVGFPNVGKSTLLSVVSSARPKIANYHFTTLSPNLGVVKYYDDSFVVADIPGLIEGASSGAGLGHDFLRHVERVRLIVHVVDISGSENRDPIEDYKLINNEIATYSERLYGLPQIVVANKSDLLTDESKFIEFEKATGTKLHRVSAITKSGVMELVKDIYDTLQELPKAAPMDFEKYEYPEEDKFNYDIIIDEDGFFVLEGGLIDSLMRNVVLDDLESFQYFQKLLREKGVIKALKKAGAEEGSTVRIGDIEFDFVI